MDAQRSYLLIDGENIDATLGQSVLGRRPNPEERPRWNKLMQSVEEHWGQPVVGLFFLAANNELPMSFIQALTAMGYRPIPLRGEGKIVDIAIQRTAEALLERPDDVALVSHDADFVPQMTRLARTPGRRTAAIGFIELMSGELRKIPDIELIDLEYDIEAFKTPLPRIKIIEIDEFDPYDFI